MRATPETLRARAAELARQARRLEDQAARQEHAAEHKAQASRIRETLQETAEKARGSVAEMAERFRLLVSDEAPWMKPEHALALMQAEIARNARARRAVRNVTIMRLARRGYSNQEIAEQLFRSSRIHLHAKSISRIVQATLRGTP